MPSGILPGIVALVLAVQVADSRACSPRAPESPAQTPPTAPPPAGPPSDVVTTADGVRLTVETVATNLEIPWSMAFAPDGRLFVTERPGRVRILDAATRTSELALVLDDVYTQSEAGLLGLALDPQFSENRLVYLYQSARLAGGGAVNRVVRYREAGSRLAERVVLLDNIPAAPTHDGGRMRFGPDGLLYITAGDASNASRAQDLASTAGKILRINRDGTTPRDNPFGSPVYSYGHRNPQGLDWHPVTGDLWASEHGNTGNDEVNAIDAGANYGWPQIEGGAAMAGMRTPITFYNPAIAPSGASFYRGNRFPRFVDNLFIGTLRGTHVLRLVVDSSAPRGIASQERLLEGRFGRSATSSPARTVTCTCAPTTATAGAARRRPTTALCGWCRRRRSDGGQRAKGKGQRAKGKKVTVRWQKGKWYDAAHRQEESMETLISRYARRPAHVALQTGTDVVEHGLLRTWRRPAFGRGLDTAGRQKQEMR